MGTVIPFIISTPADIAVALGLRVRERRLERGWTQSELAARASVALDTLKKFERTGQVSLPRLVRLAIALGCATELEGLFREPAPQSLKDLGRPHRRRGRSLGPTAGAK